MEQSAPRDFSYFYELMYNQKVAYDTSAATLSRVEVVWRKSLAPFWAKKEPKDINHELVVEFINWHKKARPGIQLINVFKYLGNIMQTMVESGALDIAKKPKLELPKDEQKHHATQKGRYITDVEFEKIYQQSSGWFRLFFIILFTSGFRKMELGKLEVSRLKKIGEHYVAILGTENTKTGSAREVPISNLLTPLIEQQLTLGSPYLFPSPADNKKHIKPQTIDEKWQRAKKEAGIAGKMRLHDCRHSCASNLAKDAVNPIVVVTNLGMSLTMFQKTYLKLKAEDLFVASDSSNKRLGKI